MNRFIMTVAVATVAASSVMAQSNDPVKMIDNAKAKIATSDKEIQDAKKGQNFKVWENRGKIFVDASKVNTKGVVAGMQASKTEANPFQNLEIFSGNPISKEAGENGMEIWVYPTIKYYIQNNQIQYWEETAVADPDALDKAAEAYRKAAELDPKGAYKEKKPTMDLIKDLRTTFYNHGINAYFLKDYKTASHDFEGALKLSDFPRDEKDTVLGDGLLAYYAALSAFQAGEKSSAATLFEKAASDNYQPGSCYHYIYQINMDEGKEDVAFKTIQEAYKKFPKEESILYDVINYYLGKQMYKEAEDYLNTAIASHPDNLMLYNVKASMFVTEYGKVKEQYQKDMDKISSLKKEAFRERNNPKEKARVEGEIVEAEKAAAATKAKYFENQAKAKGCYNDALKQKNDDYQSLFMLGIIAYDEADIIAIEKAAIPLSEDKDGSKSKAKDDEIAKCWKTSCEYFEKSYNADKTKKDPLSNLKILYYKLGDTANNKRVKDLLDSMN